MILKREPKTEHGKENLKKLTKAAEKVFYKKGYFKSTIKDITEEAGIGVGTFYVYFKGKRSIYDYLLHQYSHEIRQKISSEIEKKRPKSRREEERIGLRTFLETVKENKGIYKIIWESLYIEEDVFKNYYKSFAASYILNLSEAREDNQVKNFDLEIMSYILMGAANFIGLNWVIFNDADSAELDIVSNEAIRILEKGMFK